MKISMCAYQDGQYDLFIIDDETGKEICLQGTRKFTDEERAFFNKLMPACVFTKYEMKNG